jgi:hypothetical protein
MIVVGFFIICVAAYRERRFQKGEDTQRDDYNTLFSVFAVILILRGLGFILPPAGGAISPEFSFFSISFLGLAVVDASWRGKTSVIALIAEVALLFFLVLSP